MTMKRLLALAMTLVLLLTAAASAEEIYSDAIDEQIADVEVFLEGDAAPAEAETTPAEEEAPAGEEAPEEEIPIPLTEMKLAVKSVTLGVGETVFSPLVLVPENANTPLTLTNSKPKVVAVNDDGTLTALKKGSSVVTVKADNGLMVKYKVVVKAAPKKLTLKLSAKKLIVGDVAKATVKLPSGTAGAVAFSSSDASVLAVTPAGQLTAVAPGAATVTVTAFNGVSASAEVTVREDPMAGWDNADSGLFDVIYMSVGRNDGILLRCGNEVAYIDSGMRQQGVKAVEFMRRRGVTHLKYYIGSHAHKDHVGGAPYIMSQIPTDEVLVSHVGTANAIKKYATDAAERAAANAAKYRILTVGEHFKLGGVDFEVLGPTNILKTSPKYTAENYNSLIVKATYGSTTFLFTGDATGAEMKKVETANPGCMDVDVLKNPHHHGRQEYAVKRATPVITVLSTASSCLPSKAYLNFLKSMGSDYYITADNRDGHVRITSDGKTLTVYTQN